MPALLKRTTEKEDSTRAWTAGTYPPTKQRTKTSGSFPNGLVSQSSANETLSCSVACVDSSGRRSNPARHWDTQQCVAHCFWTLAVLPPTQGTPPEHLLLYNNAGNLSSVPNARQGSTLSRPLNKTRVCAASPRLWPLLSCFIPTTTPSDKPSTMTFGYLFKNTLLAEHPVLLCGLNNDDKLLLWQRWKRSYGAGTGTSLGNPRAVLLEIPGADKIKLHHVDSDGVDARKLERFSLIWHDMAKLMVPNCSNIFDARLPPVDRRSGQSPVRP